jgi:hypothetical protein
VDCTASDAPPANYLEWMGKGINIITPNKKLGSGPLERYQAVRRMQRESYIHFFYEVRQLPSTNACCVSVSSLRCPRLGAAIGQGWR